MADEKNGNSNGNQPPKIKINGSSSSGNGSPETSQAPQQPPRVSSQAQQFKAQTARIDFSDATLPPTATPLKIGKAGEPKKATSRLDLSIGVKEMSPEELEELSKQSTIRITAPAEMEPMAEEDKQEAIKKSTVKIDDAVMQPFSEEQKEEGLKKATVRIDTPADIQPMSEEDKSELAKKTTARVIIDEERAKGDTTRIEPATTEPSEAAKKRTARIDLGEVLDDEQDIFKRRTALIDSSKFAGETDAPGSPRTIRVKRPDIPPTTQLPRPPGTDGGDVAGTISEVEAARKSETARIDLPPEVADQPPTRKKTIRIKRPGSSTTGSKPLVITRTTADAGDEPGIKPASKEKDSPLFAWIAIAAVIVSAVLIYVLASQVGTIEELLPSKFPYPGGL